MSTEDREIDYDRKRHDDAAPFLYSPGYDTGAAVNFVGATLRFIMAPAGSTTPKVDAAAVIDGDSFEYAPVPADVDTMGRYHVEWEVTYSNGKIETWPTEGFLICVIRADLG